MKEPHPSAMMLARSSAVTQHGDIPLDNTRAERAVRTIVVDRKNLLFYGTDTHAEAAAANFSIIAT